MKKSNFISEIKHSNRSLKNELSYRLLDGFLENHAHEIKGICYDLGCGEAPYKGFYLKYAEDYVGVDWDGCIHDSRADVIADLNQKLELEDEVADTVVSISVMEHLHDPFTFVGEIYRILAPGGALLLQVPWQWRTHESPYDYYRFSAHALDRMLNEAGFSSITIKPGGGVFTMLALKLNYLVAKAVKGPRGLKFVSGLIAKVIFHLSNFLGPRLDRFDKNWSVETVGFFVVAKK